MLWGQGGAQFTGGLALADAFADAFPFRIVCSAVDTIGLARYGGSWAGNQTSGASQLATPLPVLLNTDNTIDATGADTTAAPASGTLHYCYLSSGNASAFPNDLRLSETAPSLVSGVYYLGTSGNALEWRFVGWVYVDGSGEFQDSVTARHTINYYNRRALPLLTCPAFVDDNAQTTYGVNLATFTSINGGTGDSVTFVSNGEDPVVLYVQAACSAASGTTAFVGPGFDSTTQPEVVAAFRGTGSTATAVASKVLTAGFRTGYLLCCTQTTAYTMIADTARFGAAADPPATFLAGWVMG